MVPIGYIRNIDVCLPLNLGLQHKNAVFFGVSMNVISFTFSVRKILNKNIDLVLMLWQYTVYQLCTKA